jgi:hypothetical protein
MRTIASLRNVEPCERVQQRRALYAWLVPTKGPEGRGGSIDQDVCDGIGQLHALGLLDGHGFEAQDLRDKGREWRDLWVTWMRRSAMIGGGFEPKMDGTPTLDPFYADALTEAQRERFEKLDRGLESFERSVLLSLLVDPVVGSRPDGKDDAAWVMSHIAYALLEKKKPIPQWMQPVRFPDAYDHNLLQAAIRGLCVLVDGSLPARFERRAA